MNDILKLKCDRSSVCLDVVKRKVFDCLRENQFVLDSLGKAILIEKISKALDEMDELCSSA